MGEQLPPACKREAALMNWEFPLAVQAKALSSAQLKRVGDRTQQSLLVRDSESVYRVWNVPSLRDYLQADSVPDDRETHLSKKQKRDLLQLVQVLEERTKNSHISTTHSTSHIAPIDSCCRTDPTVRKTP